MEIKIGFDKEYYIKQIKEVGEYLINKSDYILSDFDTDRIREINISFNLKPGEIPTIDINKNYIPLKIKEDKNG